MFYRRYRGSPTSPDWERLEKLGQQFAGHLRRWKAPVARALGVGRRTIYHWGPPELQPIPPYHILHLEHLCAMRAAGIEIKEIYVAG